MLQGQGALHYFVASAAQESGASGRDIGKEASSKDSSRQQRRFALALEKKIFNSSTQGWSSLRARHIYCCTDGCKPDLG